MPRHSAYVIEPLGFSAVVSDLLPDMMQCLFTPHQARRVMNFDDHTHHGLPVAGYRSQTSDAVAMVNLNKMMEERCLVVLDELKANPAIDQRWLAIGRTQLEQAWMAINRAVFQPARATAHPIEPPPG
jgi:hypothetical protein